MKRLPVCLVPSTPRLSDGADEHRTANCTHPTVRLNSFQDAHLTVGILLFGAHSVFEAHDIVLIRVERPEIFEKRRLAELRGPIGTTFAKRRDGGLGNEITLSQEQTWKNRIVIVFSDQHWCRLQRQRSGSMVAAESKSPRSR